MKRTVRGPFPSFIMRLVCPRNDFPITVQSVVVTISGVDWLVVEVLSFIVCDCRLWDRVPTTGLTR